MMGPKNNWRQRMAREIMSIEDVADYLRLSRNTIYRLIRSGEIPGRKLGNQWRIRKPLLDKVLEMPGENSDGGTVQKV